MGEESIFASLQKDLLCWKSPKNEWLIKRVRSIISNIKLIPSRAGMVHERIVSLVQAIDS